MTTEICGHNVKWHVSSKSIAASELSDFEVERIEKLICEGFTSGEIHMDYTTASRRNLTTGGWWEIVNWQDIALELYQQLKRVGPNSFLKKDQASYKKAIKRFDQNWE